ncbi:MULTISPECIES: monovalent cation/H+ antiporter complex subunit F [Acetomicrobium]|jgi:multicomponent Na+:H+ antiporter subunit F|uniref:Cation:proton antiporter n=2 Tax=Acetomicrobium hydrogeniformans TaxID=649746 RepID=A0A7V6ZD22_9BACT|nr:MULTISPECIES: monovalent cation/H+ antiporter complex subunit F [Acetomicrobium]KRT34606.1 putative Na(+)/H(+) antiporter subunit F [Acetomicrobium hydrogeniformans ATCC BAA-1850]HHZ03637.1 cation:proton antiporter [Acetomicrobium hydrogeniformans]
MSVFSFAFLILSLAILAMSGRLIMGPTVPDRVVALDTLNTFVVATMVILGALFDSIVMVDIAIVYAALSFVGTLFIARYIEGGF